MGASHVGAVGTHRGCSITQPRINSPIFLFWRIASVLMMATERIVDAVFEGGPNLQSEQ